MQKVRQNGGLTRRSKVHYAQAALLTLILAFLAGGSAPQAQVQPSCLGGSEKNFVGGILTSIKQFELVGRQDISFTRFPIGRESDPKVSSKFITLDVKNLRSEDFVALERDGTDLTETQAVVAPPRTYEGSVDGEPGSKVVLYLTPQFASGFLKDNDGWFFVEPVRPLLLPLVYPNNPMSTFTEEEVNSCIPADSLIHIVYEAKNTEFFIGLDPTPFSKPDPIPFQANAWESHPAVSQSSQNGFGPVDVTLVADQAYYDFYKNVVKEKTWWEAEEEVLSAVDALYSAQFPGLVFKERALEAWAKGGPGAAASAARAAAGLPNINAYDLLCDFAEGYPVPPAPPPPGWLHSHSEGYTLVQLFSGQDLGPFPSSSAPKGISDGGDGLCPGSGCGTVGTDIVGLAEGIGGVRGSFSNSCWSGGLTAFEPPAHHALSQQVPKLTPKEAQHADPPQDISELRNFPTSTWKYQATLFQRLLLTAHEFGHILAAHHDEWTSPDPASPCEMIMCSVLNQKIGFEFSNPSWSEIHACLVNGNCASP